MSKREILVLVEGQVTDVKLMERLLTAYGIYEEHQIVYYGTDVYSLYDALFRNKEGLAVLDLPLHLRSRESDPDKKEILSKCFSRILLVFDLDPQSTHFLPERAKAMAEYFNDSTDVGLLYLNYPMIEAFFHIKSIPDPDYIEYTASLSELKRKKETYKDRVSKESCIIDRRGVFQNRNTCNTIIRHNLEKAWQITGETPSVMLPMPSQDRILQKQLETVYADAKVGILCTCCLYIVDYNPNLIQE